MPGGPDRPQPHPTGPAGPRGHIPPTQGPARPPRRPHEARFGRHGQGPRTEARDRVTEGPRFSPSLGGLGSWCLLPWQNPGKGGFQYTWPTVFPEENACGAPGGPCPPPDPPQPTLQARPTAGPAAKTWSLTYPECGSRPLCMLAFGSSWLSSTKRHLPCERSGAGAQHDPTARRCGGDRIWAL